MKCLLVDDDIDFATMMTTTIRSWGHEAVVCHNWLSVMVKLKEHSIDLIIADVETPTGNGLSVMEYLTHDPVVNQLPRVFVTGLNDDQTKQRCAAMNAHHIHKSSTVMKDLRDYIENQHAETSSVS